ncbi:MAG: DNA-binding protein [Desulfatiglandaceae bacterium]
MELTYTSGRLDRAALARLAPGADVIESIEEICRQMDFKCATVTSCIGSLRRADIMIAVPLENKLGAGYSDPIALEGPLELLCAQGTVGEDEREGFFTHLHVTFSDRDGRLWGGHLLKGKGPVLVTCEVMITELAGGRLCRQYDPEVELSILKP